MSQDEFPKPDPVHVPGSAAFKASMRPRTASTSAVLVGPKLEPPEPAPLFGIGDVAESRPQKYFASWNDWPISEDPTTLPLRINRLPDTWSGKTALPMPVTTKGYTRPVSTVSTTNNTSRGRSISFMNATLYASRSAVSPISISLMPAKGTMMPPTP
jgi:hypothetical protein